MVDNQEQQVNPDTDMVSLLADQNISLDRSTIYDAAAIH